jgi:ferritin-like metal-binding protein YciE
MGVIKLDDDFRIETDIASWNLVYEKTHQEIGRAGKPKVSRNMTFHANLKHALQAYLDESAKQADSVESLLEVIKQAESNIEKACLGIKKGDVK